MDIKNTRTNNGGDSRLEQLRTLAVKLLTQTEEIKTELLELKNRLGEVSKK